MVVAYDRMSDGSLQYIGGFETGGQGVGPNNVLPGLGAMTTDPLASNYSLQMAEDNQFVFAVNAGSNELSSFQVNDDYSLSFASIISTVGVNPVSIASSGQIVYVSSVNGGVGVVEGFSFNNTGQLTPIENSLRKLSGRPTAIRFTKDGDSLVAVERDTQTIRVYPRNGEQLGEPSIYVYPQPEVGRNFADPFGLETLDLGNGRQTIVISEARVFAQDGTAAPQTSSISTFRIDNRGNLRPRTFDVLAGPGSSLTDGQITSCWAVEDSVNGLIVTSNTFANSMSTFRLLGSSGRAAIDEPVAFAVSDTFSPTVGGLTDLVAIDGFVYQLLAEDGGVLSLETSTTNKNGTGNFLIEIGRDLDLSAAGGNQGITGF